MRTVAGTLTDALSGLFEQPLRLTVAGRTDAGVHALGQVVSFAAHARFPSERLAIAANARLPRDCSVRETARVFDGFSARSHALERCYRYVVLNRATPSAVLQRFAHHDHRSLDLDAMRAVASLLVGRRDFASFCAVRPEVGGTVRELRAVEIARDGERLCFELRANGFLHRMVRIVVGTLLAVGAGERKPEDLSAILAARDRRLAGPTAPPQGLFLVGVRYPDFDSGAL